MNEERGNRSRVLDWTLAGEEAVDMLSKEERWCWFRIAWPVGITFTCRVGMEVSIE